MKTYTLAFDIYGTLIDTSGVSVAVRQYVKDNTDDFVQLWRSKQLEYSFRKGLMGKYEDFGVCTAQALDYCCLAFNILLSAQEKERLMLEYKVLPKFEEVEGALSALKDAGHRLFAFSNGSNEALYHLLDHAGIYDTFEKVISMKDIAMFKPHPSGYQHFLDKAGAEVQQAFLISSNPFDIIGAASYGMHTAWVRRSKNSIFDPWGIQPNYVLSSLLELQAVLAGHG
ncbi:haloacid dehalogenase type II [Persicobacter diffluens]|uniref:Haloacetate dehalogenase n=1 Tax=Persicobacter diffluens TaxID=981 RepID=A0AAN5AKN9_9BACT|nr:haloacetate dehalogenase [Persicobacter diffluens]